MKHIKLFEQFINEKKFTKTQVEDLLEVNPEKITVESDEVTVVVSGNELGYDDDQYYEITWYISDKRVESGTFKDSRLKNYVFSNQYSEEVDSLEAFANVLNGKSKGEFN